MESNFSASSKGTNVQVAVRCRPMNNDERKAGQPSVITCDQQERRLQVSYGPAGKKITKSFNFDKVFGMYSTQEEVFEQMVRPIVDETLAGFNCTIFAYGQTGTGKTHTMEGDIHSEENSGIVPRAVKSILEQLESSGAEFTIRVSFLELYNEELQDLLNTTGDKKLKLCEDIKKGVVCQNLEEITVLNASDIFDILQKGIQQRQTAETLCNKNSSRSHSIFTMKIMIKECNVDGEEVVRNGQLNLVDLAGSECIGRSGAKNDRAREAGSINQSLLTLGRVITALVDHHGHIPYRDSKLTRLLQESLGGKAKTCIIATLSPSQLAMEESLSTLDYAYRAKNIKNQPTVNQKLTKKVVLKEYCAEIESLKAQLQITREKNGVYVEPNEYYAMEARISSQESQLLECEAALKLKTEELKYLKTENSELSGNLEETKLELTQFQENLEKITEKLQITKADLEITEIELKATEAVVSEQTITEDQLHEQGHVLQDEVVSRRHDVEILLSKVDRFVTLENRRLKQTQEMMANLTDIKLSLEAKSDAYKTLSDDHSKLLQSGVSDMLCWVGDATKAKDAMKESCVGLNDHLVHTNEAVAGNLMSVKETLTTWLTTIQTSVTDTEKQLMGQQQTLNALSQSMKEEMGSYFTECDQMVTIQKEFSLKTVTESQKLRQTLVDRISSFQKSQQENKESNEKLLKSQAAMIEQKMKILIQEMVAQNMSILDDNSSSLSTFCENVSTIQNEGFSTIEQNIESHTSSTIDRIHHQNSRIKVADQKQAELLKTVNNSRSKASEMLHSVSGSVVTQTELLDSEVTKSVQELNESTIKSCRSVNETSLAAEKVLKDVTSSTETMNESAEQLLSQFISFLDNHGEHINKELAVHFTSLNSHYEDEKQGLSDINSSITMYGSDMLETKVSITGKTPQKQVYSELAQLASTREHDSIKEEVKCEIKKKPIENLITTELMNTFAGQIAESSDLDTPTSHKDSASEFSASMKSNISLEENIENIVNDENLKTNNVKRKLPRMGSKEKMGSGKSKTQSSTANNQTLL